MLPKEHECRGGRPIVPWHFVRGDVIREDSSLRACLCRSWRRGARGGSQKSNHKSCDAPPLESANPHVRQCGGTFKSFGACARVRQSPIAQPSRLPDTFRKKPRSRNLILV